MSDELIEGHCDRCGDQTGDNDDLIFTFDKSIDGFRYMCLKCREEIERIG